MLRRDEQAWNAILQDLADLGVLPYQDSVLTLPIPNFFLDLDQNIAEKELSTEEFNLIPRQVERLINQAAELLDRCLSDRAEFDRLRSQAFEEWLELCRFVRVDQIHTEEIEAGIYDLSHQRTVAELEAERRRWYSSEEASSALQERLHLFDHDEAIEQEVKDRETQGYVGAAPATRGAREPWYKPGWPSGIGGNKMDAMATLESQSAMRYLARDRLSSEIQAVKEHGEFAAIGTRLHWLERNAAWTEKEREFQSRRVQIDRDAHDLRAREFTKKNGALAYVERSKQVYRRFIGDFREALARLRAVEAGLLEVYQCKYPLPEELTIESLVEWSRAVINWLVRWSQHEQSTTIVCSAKRILGAEGLSNALQSGVLELELREPIEARFSFARMRGLSVHVEANSSNGIQPVWRLQVQLPQEDVPILEVGRAFSRAVARPADLLGAISTHNAVPFGHWRIILPEEASVDGSTLRAQIADVQLDLQISFRR